MRWISSLSVFRRSYVPPPMQPPALAALTGHGEISQPSADDTDGGWTRETGSAVDLFASIDELTVDLNDYIKSAADPVNDICKIKLANPPGGGTVSQLYRVNYVYGRQGDPTIELRVRLLEGTTERASWTHSDIPLGPVLAEQVLTSGEFAAITNFDNLYLEFRGNAS